MKYVWEESDIRQDIIALHGLQDDRHERDKPKYLIVQEDWNEDEEDNPGEYRLVNMHYGHIEKGTFSPKEVASRLNAENCRPVSAPFNWQFELVTKFRSLD